MGVVTLKVDGYKDREVVHCSYDLRQETDMEGQPSAVTRGGKIHVKVKSLNEGNTQFLEWMCDPFLSKGGELSFLKRDGTNMKTLKFKDAYLVEYEEIYDSLDDNSQYELFTISAKEIEMSGINHKNKWTED
jgi:hypothetical protein